LSWTRQPAGGTPIYISCRHVSRDAPWPQAALGLLFQVCSALTPHPAALGGLGFCCSTSAARSSGGNTKPLSGAGRRTERLRRPLSGERPAGLRTTRAEPIQAMTAPFTRQGFVWPPQATPQMWCEAVKFGGDSGAMREVSDIEPEFSRPSFVAGITSVSGNRCQGIKLGVRHTVERTAPTSLSEREKDDERAFRLNRSNPDLKPLNFRGCSPHD
jgi:hypothetical protein